MSIVTVRLIHDRGMTEPEQVEAFFAAYAATE